MAIIAILLLSDVIGIVPDRGNAVLDGRKKIVETLAIQYSMSAKRRDYESIESSMRLLVGRNDEILSAALRNYSGRVIALAGNHDERQFKALGERSTPTHIQVPIYSDVSKRGKWGSVEFEFTDPSVISMFGIPVRPVYVMAAFVGVVGFLVFMVLIKKIFTNIDPSSVVPKRVKRALDTLAEGVILVNEKGRILFVNEVFTNMSRLDGKRLLGHIIDRLAWHEVQGNLPWKSTLEKGDSVIGSKMLFRLDDGDILSLVVNSSPVHDEDGKRQGAMITFDDVTELEKTNDELKLLVSRLKQSSNKISQQNEELRFLATRDPLTSCMNRRSLFEQYNSIYQHKIRRGERLCSLMLDIDHFKTVNDTFGHAAGDEVIRLVASAVKESIRDDDEVFRYGGEEFCVLLPGVTEEEAYEMADRIRRHIESLEVVISDVKRVSVTVSIGIASAVAGPDSLGTLLEAADVALYESKHKGRNLVSIWSPDIADTARGRSDTVLEKAAILPSRADFRIELEKAIDSRVDDAAHVATMVLDIDNFQRINNVFGQNAGDALLTEIQQRLVDATRRTDTTCRISGESVYSVYGLGGDEFGVVISYAKTTEDIRHIADRLKRAVSDSVMIDEHLVNLTCSIGICVYPDNCDDIDGLLTCSSAALVKAKQDGGNTCKFYENDIVEQVRKEYQVESSLSDALLNDEMELYYQPQLDVQTQQIVAMESLIRWNHPEHGLILPSVFIPVSERSGQIIDLGKWVLNAACRQIRVWSDMGLDIPVAVNLSTRQFMVRDLVQTINHAVVESGINPGSLHLEVTESTLMEDVEHAKQTMQELVQLGYHIAVDDFGTGYSSLEYIRNIPAETLKIDRAFVRDMATEPRSVVIIRAAINMAHELGMKVVAEGVETEEQLIFLREMRCDMVQGYLLGRPLPADSVISVAEELEINRFA